MDVAGSDCVYLSDECSQDVFSLWSDVWSVGDPVNMPELNYDDEFTDIFPAAVVQSSHDNGDWLSDVLESACPNTIAGYVAASSDGSGELLSVTTCADIVDCDDVLSPTDSGHDSIVSPVTTADRTSYIVANGDGFVEGFKKDTSDLNSRLNNNNDVRFVPDLISESCCIPVSSQEMDNKHADAETELVSPRPQRVAARRTEIALAGEGSSDCDDDDEDDDDMDEVEDAQPRVRSRRQLPSASITSRCGRRRAAEVNRNALNARINRQKKKAYMTSLETQKAHLLNENKHLKLALTSLVHERDELVDEVTYLKSVLANDSVLAKLVHSINGPPLKLSSRFDPAVHKRKDVEFDHNYGPCGKRRRSDIKVGGICLHVNENQLSMELCHRCACMADTGRSSDCE